MSDGAWFNFGIVPADEAERAAADAYKSGYVYQNDSRCFTKGKRHGGNTKFDVYAPGDTITVRVDLERCEISFLKNGAATGSTQAIEGGGAYNFTFDVMEVGCGATIVAIS